MNSKPHTEMVDGHPVEIHPPIWGESKSVFRERFSDMPEQVRETVLKWADDMLAPTKEFSSRTSYGLKHEPEDDTGIYMNNNQFKDMMLQIGYEPEDWTALNWSFRADSKRYLMPEPVEGTFRWYIMRKARPKGGPAAGFVEDVKADRTFPDTCDKEEIDNYLFGHRACCEALSAFKSLWKNYKSYTSKKGATTC